MADTSSLRAYINANMTSYGTQSITGPEVVTCLLSLCDFLDAYGTTFNKVGTTSAGANAEDVYHTGKVGIGNTSPTEQVHITGNALVDGILKFPDTTASRKIALYGANTNDHQFFGFGVNSGAIRYQVGDTSSNHVFYAGVSPVTSNELMRLYGTGLLQQNGGQRISGASIPSTGVGLELQYGVVANTASIYAYDRGTSAYKNVNIESAQLLLNSGTSGFVGINTSSPSSILHVKGATGHQQLRLETAYTPTSTSDSNGQVGQIAWDASYLYLKTGSGWKRTAALSTF